MARLNPDGSYDVSFGNGGWLRVMELRNNLENKHAVAVQPDGKIVVAGNYKTNLGAFTVLRLNRDGSPDKTFGNAGFAVLGGEDDRVFGLAMQPDGKIVAAGTVGGKPYKFAVVRFNANGSLDSGFGGGGIVAIELQAVCGNCQAVDLAVQADGKIVAVGGNKDFPVVRLTRNGTLDSTFGNDGVALSSGLEGLDTVSAIAVQADGRIVVAGNALTSFFDYKSKGIYFDRIPEGTLRYDIALVRYNADGSIDSSFGKGGLLTTDFGSPSDCAYAVKVQPDGKIVAAGSNNDACILLARYADIDVRPGSAVIAKTTPAKVKTPAAVNKPAEAVTQAGLMDPAFGNGGLIVDVDNGEAHAITTLRDGKIIVAGQVETGPDSGSADFAVACYNPDGSPDSSFG